MDEQRVTLCIRAPRVISIQEIDEAIRQLFPPTSRASVFFEFPTSPTASAQIVTGLRTILKECIDEALGDREEKKP